MPIGKISDIDFRNGFCFVEPEDGGNRVYVKIAQLLDADIPFPKIGLPLSFRIAEHDNGRRSATDVAVLEPASA